MIWWFFDRCDRFLIVSDLFFDVFLSADPGCKTFVIVVSSGHRLWRDGASRGGPRRRERQEKHRLIKIGGRHFLSVMHVHLLHRGHQRVATDVLLGAAQAHKAHDQHHCRHPPALHERSELPSFADNGSSATHSCGARST